MAAMAQTNPTTQSDKALAEDSAAASVAIGVGGSTRSVGVAIVATEGSEVTGDDVSGTVV